MDFLQFSYPEKEASLHFAVSGWGVRTKELPSIWQVHKWLCLPLSLFARTVLSTLHLLAQLILQLQYERGITVAIPCYK